VNQALRAVLLVTLVSVAAAQTSPFLPDDLHRKLNNELSGEIAFDYLRDLTKFHAPNGGSRDVRAEAQWIAAKAKEVGLQDVIIHKLPWDGIAWTPISGEAWLVETVNGKPVETKLGSFEATATAIADFSRPTKVEAELIDVGRGTDDIDYAGKDVKGKIVLASGPATEVEAQAVWKRGALGIVSDYSTRIIPADYPDQIPWSRIHDKAEKDGPEPAFAWMVSYRTGLALRQKLSGRATTDFMVPAWAAQQSQLPIRVRVNIDSRIDPDNHQEIVEGWIRGTNHSQQVVLTSHMQEEKFSANDDRSGVANTLEIARALNKLIAEGKLPRPDRDIRFWWTNEIEAEYAYFAEHPDERKNIFVNVNQDMVGSNQSIGGISRVQQVTFTPWSRPTFFNDVIESVITALYHGNNSYIAARQAGSATPGSQYSKPIYSLLGSRDRYSVELVPFFNSTDHMVFNDAAIGATHGGTTFTNWPDEYIHSSADDLWQMDRTTLKRNALAVSALALYMANVKSDNNIYALSEMLRVKAVSRIFQRAANVEAAIQQKTAEPFSDRYNVISAAEAVEWEAVKSLQSLATDGSNSNLDVAIKTALSGIARATATLERKAPPDVIVLQHELQNAMGRIPTRNPNLAQYIHQIDDIKKVKGLSPLMAYEALNFADGKRSMWDIYLATRAESLGEGEWYYGKVTPELIQEFFNNAAAVGAVTLAEPKPEPAKPKQKKK
jgi:Zn-dependent M28 family amino/carboxypeptidase